jgi:hypothetical protein
MLPSLFYLIGGVTCFLTKRCQRIGDIAAGTLVIREVESSPPSFEELVRIERNSFATLPHLEARPPPENLTRGGASRDRRDDPSRRTGIRSHGSHLFSQLADHFREIAEFPEEITIGLSDEQYVRNVGATLFRRASV